MTLALLHQGRDFQAITRFLIVPASESSSHSPQERTQKWFPPFTGTKNIGKPHLLAIVNCVR